MAVRRELIDEIGPFPGSSTGARTRCSSAGRFDRYGSAVVHDRPDMRVTDPEPRTRSARTTASIEPTARATSACATTSGSGCSPRASVGGCSGDTVRKQRRPPPGPGAARVPHPGPRLVRGGAAVPPRRGCARPAWRAPAGGVSPGHTYWWRASFLRVRRGARLRTRGAGRPPAGHAAPGRRRPGRLRLRPAARPPPAKRRAVRQDQPGERPHAREPGGVPPRHLQCRRSGRGARTTRRGWGKLARPRPTRCRRSGSRSADSPGSWPPRRRSAPCPCSRSRRWRRGTWSRPATGVVALLGLTIGVRWDGAPPDERRPAAPGRRRSPHVSPRWAAACSR